MTTITIQIPDEQAEKWQQEAERLNLTLEELTTQSVEERLAGRSRYITQAIQRIITENEELYRRLA